MLRFRSEDGSCRMEDGRSVRTAQAQAGWQGSGFRTVPQTAPLRGRGG